MNAASGTVGRAMYPVAEAARLAHMRPLTVRRWVDGYDYRHKGQARHSEGVPYLRDGSGLRKSGDRKSSPLLSFEQLLTLLLVQAFHKKGLSLPKIKQAASMARTLYGVENPFVTRQFRSDGNKVFLDLAEDTHGKERQLIDLFSHQREFHEFVEPSLFRDVVFTGNQAGEWRPLGLKRSVTVSPSKQFGAPHIVGTGVRTDVVAEMVNAEGGDDAAKVAAAEWFGLSAEQVADAVEFEGEWLNSLPPS